MNFIMRLYWGNGGDKKGLLFLINLVTACNIALGRD